MSTTEIEDIPPLPDLDATDAIIGDADAAAILAAMPSNKQLSQDEFRALREDAMRRWYPYWTPRWWALRRVSAWLELQRTCIHEHPRADQRRCADCGLSFEDICNLEDRGVFVAA